MRTYSLPGGSITIPTGSATNQIVSLCCIDCRETDLNSVIMERLGFQRAMAEVMAHVKVGEVVTDAHPQIAALMRICLFVGLV